MSEPRGARPFPTAFVFSPRCLAYHVLSCLGQNIINEKIYLVLWFWMAFLCIVSFFFFFYRLLTFFCPCIRFNLIYKTVS